MTKVTRRFRKSGRRSRISRRKVYGGRRKYMGKNISGKGARRGAKNCKRSRKSRKFISKRNRRLMRGGDLKECADNKINLFTDSSVTKMEKLTMFKQFMDRNKLNGVTEDAIAVTLELTYCFMSHDDAKEITRCFYEDSSNPYASFDTWYASIENALSSQQPSVAPLIPAPVNSTQGGPCGVNFDTDKFTVQLSLLKSTLSRLVFKEGSLETFTVSRFSSVKIPSLPKKDDGFFGRMSNNKFNPRRVVITQRPVKYTTSKNEDIEKKLWCIGWGEEGVRDDDLKYAILLSYPAKDSRRLPSYVDPSTLTICVQGMPIKNDVLSRPVFADYVFTCPPDISQSQVTLTQGTTSTNLKDLPLFENVDWKETYNLQWLCEAPENAEFIPYIAGGGFDLLMRLKTIILLLHIENILTFYGSTSGAKLCPKIYPSDNMESLISGRDNLLTERKNLVADARFIYERNLARALDKQPDADDSFNMFSRDAWGPNESKLKSQACESQGLNPDCLDKPNAIQDNTRGFVKKY